MQFVDNLRTKPAVQKIEKFFPAIAFLGGFGWDSVTLGMSIKDSDLIFLLAYYTIAFILVVLLSAKLDHPEGWTPDRIKAASISQNTKASQNPFANTKINHVANNAASTVVGATDKLASKMGL